MQTDVAGLLAELERRGDKLALAESLTGGLLSAVVVAVPGASKSYLGGVVAYQSEVKHGILGVNSTSLNEYGPVSAQVAAEMALGIRDKLAKICEVETQRVIGLSTTGVAGPDPQGGASVGQVFVGIAGFLGDIEDTRVYELQLTGTRNEIREQAAAAALEHLAEYLAI